MSEVSREVAASYGCKDAESALESALPSAINPMFDGWRTKAAALVEMLKLRGYAVVPLDALLGVERQVAAARAVIAELENGDHASAGRDFGRGIAHAAHLVGAALVAPTEHDPAQPTCCCAISNGYAWIYAPSFDHCPACVADHHDKCMRVSAKGFRS